MMRSIVIAIALALTSSLILANIALARPVFMKDGSRIEALSVRKSGDKIYVLVNRESQILLYAHEVDLVKTFDKKWEKPAIKTPPPPTAHSPSAVESTKPIFEEFEDIKPVTPAETKVEPPAPAEPQKVTTEPAPAPAPKPKPAPRPVVVTPKPVDAVPDFETGGAASIVILVAIFALILILLASFWIVFAKAGEAGWKSLVPIYNIIVLLKISGTPIWWIILFFLPVLNVGASVFLGINLAKKFGKGALYGLGLCFFSFIFYPHLAFSKATYQH